MEKEQPDSMATVQMTKADYAASEVYSTTSEPPPAYKRQTSSVQIAKIIGITVIASTFILGSFLLASAYLQARASCDQMQTLDNILEKELMLETLQQELPKAEALLSGRDVSNDNDLQSMDKESVTKKSTKSTQTDSESSDTDSSFSDSDESEEMNRVQIKLPLELSLSDLANAILEQNQKSRMNCVIERRRAEELVDSQARGPFGLNLNGEPQKRITGERMAIFCESGNAIKDNNEPQQPPREMHIPIQRVPITFGAIPQQLPITHMPQQQMPMPPQIPPFVIRQIIAHQQEQQQQQQQQQQQMQQQVQQQFQQVLPQAEQQVRQIPLVIRQMMPPSIHQMPPQFPVPDQMMRAPRPEGEIRIQFQRIPIREIPVEMLQGRPNMQKDSTEREQNQETAVPFRDALLREVGLTASELMHIQRLTEERIQNELRAFTADDSNNNDSDDGEDTDSDDDSEENVGTQQPMVQQQQQQHQQQQQQQQQQQSQSEQQNQSGEPDTKTSSPILPGRAAYARSILTPIDIPVNLMQVPDAPAEPERPHFVQPRSLRNDAEVDNEAEDK